MQLQCTRLGRRDRQHRGRGIRDAQDPAALASVWTPPDIPTDGGLARRKRLDPIDQIELLLDIYLMRGSMIVNTTSAC